MIIFIAALLLRCRYKPIILITLNGAIYFGHDQGNQFEGPWYVITRGRVRAVDQKEFTPDFSTTGWVEHDPNEIGQPRP